MEVTRITLEPAAIRAAVITAAPLITPVITMLVPLRPSGIPPRILTRITVLATPTHRSAIETMPIPRPTRPPMQTAFPAAATTS